MSLKLIHESCKTAPLCNSNHDKFYIFIWLAITRLLGNFYNNNVSYAFAYVWSISAFICCHTMYQSVWRKTKTWNISEVIIKLGISEPLFIQFVGFLLTLNKTLVKALPPLILTNMHRGLEPNYQSLKNYYTIFNTD